MPSLQKTPKRQRGSIIRIEATEIDRLIKDIEQQEKVRHHPDLERYRKRGQWPKSKASPVYQILKFTIDQENKQNEKVKYEIEDGFLYGLINRHTKKVGKKGGYGFYRYNLTTLYYFLYKKSREEYHLERTYDTTTKATKVPVTPIIVYCERHNENEWKHLEKILPFLSNFKITLEFWDQPGTNLTKVMQKVGEHGLLINCIDKEYLENENCIKSLTEYLAINEQKIKYLERSIHLIFPTCLQQDNCDISTDSGRLRVLSFWDEQIRRINEQIAVFLNRGDELLPQLKNYLESLKKSYDNIARNIINNVDFIYNNDRTLHYEHLLKHPKELQQLIEQVLQQEKRGNYAIILKEVKQSLSEIEQLYHAIVIPSENDPQRPEFPPQPFYQPKYPASDCYPIDIQGFSNVWLKDESSNPTGTHKDRMAWELVIKYKELLKQERIKKMVNKAGEVPRLSIISAGSAAIAIQNFLRKFHLPDLKVLLDEKTEASIQKALQKAGCEVYTYDLSRQLLKPEDIKALTHNKHGLDITYREIMDYDHKTYYDWLSYEILNHQPDFCLLPFGTGDLFQNVLNINYDEVLKYRWGKQSHDPRLQHNNIKGLQNCHFMGATTRNPQSKLNKLYSAFLPSLPDHHQKLNKYQEEGMCGQYSGIYEVSEYYTDKAIDVANSLKINFEPSGVAGLALLFQLQAERTIPIPSTAKIVIVNTGKTKYQL